MTLQLFPLDETHLEMSPITKLDYECEVIFPEVMAEYLGHENCYLVVFGERLRKRGVSDNMISSFVVRCHKTLLVTVHSSMCVCDIGIIKLHDIHFMYIHSDLSVIVD